MRSRASAALGNWEGGGATLGQPVAPSIARTAMAPALPIEGRAVAFTLFVLERGVAHGERPGEHAPGFFRRAERDELVRCHEARSDDVSRRPWLLLRVEHRAEVLVRSEEHTSELQSR